MRTLTFDPYEFDSPCTEETLELAIASKRYVSSVETFVPMVAAGSVPKGPATPLCKLFQRSLVVDYLSRFAGIQVPPDCDWPVTIFNDAWDDLELVVEAPGCFIRFHWWTTA